MARPYRLQGEGLLYHVTSRGNDRKRIFLSETDYNKFLEYIKTAKDKYKFYLYAYCLMSNHYHLLLETTQPNISNLMQYINTSYTTYCNIKRNKCGHLFQGRYKSILVDKDSYFLELTRYIHLNPIRAKMADKPEKYKWSSFNSYLDKKVDDYIDKTEISKFIDIQPNQYRQFVLEGMKTSIDPFANIYAGFILGSERFIKDKLKYLKDIVETRDFSYKKTLQKNINPETIINVIAKKYKKEPQAILNSKNRQSQEKKIAMYLLKRYTDYTNNDIGKVFGITPTAVIKAAKSFECIVAKDKTLTEEIKGLISAFSA